MTDVPSIAVAVVDAETPGNVGTIARAMKNFGLSELLLVDPPDLDPNGEAYGFAGQAREDVLPGATEISFSQLAEQYHTIGCTAITNEDATKHVRYPALTASTLPNHIRGVDTEVAVVFGRERVGLTNDELTQLDTVCAVPASSEYPSMNLGQAATVVLYELRTLTLDQTQLPDDPHERASEAAIDRFYEQFDSFLGAVGHPPEKRPKANRLIRRLIGRAHPTPREIRTLQGIIRRGTELSTPPSESGSKEEYSE